jgi:biopolymer transport protein ExbB/TolQ
MLSNNFLVLLTHGGYTVAVLILCSILSIKVIIEKWIGLTGIEHKNIEDLSNKIKEAIKANNFKEAIHLCKSNQVKRFGFSSEIPLSKVILFIFHKAKHTKDELLDLALTQMDHELIKMEKGIGILATLGNIAPFIGLFGTVIGIIKSFQGLSVNDSSSYATVMSGISEALISTAAGLVVAVTAVIFYNYYIKKIKQSIPALEKEIKEIVFMLKRETRNAPVQN